EIVDEIMRSRIAMRLEGEHEPPPRITLPQCLESCADLGGVVTVVIDDREAPDGGLYIADVLHTTLDTLEAGECALNRRIVNPHLDGHGNRRQRVEHIVQSREIH